MLKEREFQHGAQVLISFGGLAVSSVNTSNLQNMHCLFQKSYLVPLCHCLHEEKGKLKSIILTWASLIAQEFNSISSATSRGQDPMAANGNFTSGLLLEMKDASWCGRLCAEGEVRYLCLGEVRDMAGSTTCVG